MEMHTRNENHKSSNKLYKFTAVFVLMERCNVQCTVNSKLCTVYSVQ